MFIRKFTIIILGAIIMIPEMLVVVPTIFADGIYIPQVKVDNIVEPYQKAVINCMDDQEKMILNVKYSGEMNDFAWLVPTPTVPDVTEGDYQVFEDAQYFTGVLAPLPYTGGGFENSDLKAMDAQPPVTVIERKKVSVYDVSVLETVNATALAEWLNTNGYAYPEEHASLFDYYINKGWIFTAMRIAPDEYTAEVVGDLKSGTINPLIFEFDTDECVFPLRISKGNENTTDILLYVFGDTNYDTTMLTTLSAGKLQLSYLDNFPTLMTFLDYDLEDGYLMRTDEGVYYSVIRKILDPNEMNQDVVLKPVTYDNDYYTTDLSQYGVNIKDMKSFQDFYTPVEYLVRKYVDRGFADPYSDDYFFETWDEITRGDFTRYVVAVFDFNLNTYAADFSDVHSSDRNYMYIKAARSLGLLNGYADGNFYPDKKITRGEAMKITARALDKKGAIDLDDVEALWGDAQFTDVAKNHEFYTYILAAVKLGVVDGYGDRTFKPDWKITRGQSAKIVLQAKMLVKD